MISQPKLDTKKPIGNGVNAPEYAGSTTIISTKDASMSGRDVSTTASSENLSAKYKYPRVSQDIPDGAKNQYER